MMLARFNLALVIIILLANVHIILKRLRNAEKKISFLFSNYSIIYGVISRYSNHGNRHNGKLTEK